MFNGKQWRKTKKEFYFIASWSKCVERIPYWKMSMQCFSQACFREYPLPRKPPTPPEICCRTQFLEKSAILEKWVPYPLIKDCRKGVCSCGCDDIVYRTVHTGHGYSMKLHPGSLFSSLIIISFTSASATSKCAVVSSCFCIKGRHWW